MDYFPTANASSSGYSSSSSSFPNNRKEIKKKQGGKRGPNSGVMKLSTDPQSVAARERRHRISDRFKILQSLVPGGSKMDTVSMLEEAINYVKFLKAQILIHQNLMNFMDHDDPYNNNNNNNNLYLSPDSTNYLPQHQQQQQHPSSYFDANYAAAMQPSGSPLQLPDSFFQGEETMGHDPFDKI